MPVFGENEEINPHGREVEEMLLYYEPHATTHQLLEIVTEELLKTLPGGLRGKAKQNVLNFLIQNEYRHNLKDHVIRASRMRANGRWQEKNQLDNSDRVQELYEQYRAYTLENDEIEVIVADIDMVCGPGGLTKLHMAAMDGEYEEVVRLVEVLHASLFVVDNLKKTPCDRARAFGHSAIAEYLKKRMQS